MKDQKGITLVALIITIIVMLILVAVTISVALNGGLFDNAKTARNETIAEQAREAITLAKAELVSEYYVKSISAPSAADVGKLVEQYLSDDYTVTPGGANWNYTIKVEKDGTDIVVNETLDLTGMTSGN